MQQKRPLGPSLSVACLAVLGFGFFPAFCSKCLCPPLLASFSFVFSTPYYMFHGSCCKHAINSSCRDSPQRLFLKLGQAPSYSSTALSRLRCSQRLLTDSCSKLAGVPAILADDFRPLLPSLSVLSPFSSFSSLPLACPYGSWWPQ